MNKNLHTGTRAENTQNTPDKMKTIAKKTVQDSVFTDLFKNKKYTLLLYKVLHPEDLDITEEDIEIVTIHNVLLNQEYNDLGFSARKKLLILCEAQSTWTLNILPRLVLYLAQSWKEYIVSTGQNLYGSKKIELPQTEFYVLFIGERKTKPEYLTLSGDFFKREEVSLDIKVKMLYGTDGTDIISQYVNFTKIYKEQYTKYGRAKKTIQETMHICKERDILKEYLESREKEVTDIMTALFDEETILRAFLRDAEAESREKGRREGREEGREKGREEGRKEGREEGRKEGVSFGRMQEKREIALNLSDMGMPLEQIARAAQVSTDTIREWLSKAPAAVK